MKMFAALFLDPGLALVVLCALILSAAVPLAIAWTRILPEEPPPFDIHGPDVPPSQRKISYRSDYIPRPYFPKRSRFSVALLSALSVCFVLHLPGLPRYFGFHSITAATALYSKDWIDFLLASFFLLVPGLAIAHSFFKPNQLSIPLIAASVLVLLLWLLSTPLHAALVAVS
jgi:hypothetical protein